MVKVKSEALIFLESVEHIDVDIDNLLAERQQWEDRKTKITASMDGERVQSSGTKDNMAMAVIRCMEAEKEIEAEVAKLAAQKKKVTQTIAQLYSPIEKAVIHKRFVQYMTLQEIADHYGKSYEWAKDTCKRAVGHVQVILNKAK